MILVDTDAWLALALRTKGALAQSQHHGGALAANDWHRLLAELFCGPFVLDVFAVGACGANTAISSETVTCQKALRIAL